MRCGVLILAVLAVCCNLASSTLPLLAPAKGAALLGGGGIAPVVLLAGLVGLKFLAYSGGIGKRSIEEGAEVSENLLLSTVTQLDPNGCVLKLLCNAEAKTEADRTVHEAILGRIFGNDSLSSYNAAFVYATSVGRNSRDAETCDRLFSKCELNSEHLSRVLDRAWGCGMTDM